MSPTLFAILIYVVGIMLTLFLNWRLGIYLLKHYQENEQKKEKEKDD